MNGWLVGCGCVCGWLVDGTSTQKGQFDETLTTLAGKLKHSQMVEWQKRHFSF